MKKYLVAAAIAAWGLVPQVAIGQFAYTWDATFESQPADSEGAKLGASRIRDLKKATSEREKVDHSWAGDANDGKHLQSTYRVSAAKPTASGTDGYTYTKTVNGHTELFFEREDGTELQITSGGALTLANIWTTGDVKVTLKTVADPGWVLMNDGTLGDATSGATTRANADTSALFALLWANCVDADCPVSTGRGGSANADFTGHKTIGLPKALGRALAVYGSGSGLTARALGHVLGQETHTQTLNELVPHTHSSGSPIASWSNTSPLGPDIGAASGTSGSTGGGQPFNIMQPTTFLNIEIKL